MGDYDTAPLTTDNFFKKLSDLVDAPPLSGKRTAVEEALLTFVSGKELLETQFPEQKWLVESLIPDTGMVCLSGMPSSYKSWFGFYIALCILRGQSVLERFPAQQGGVLFIDKENIEPQIQERFRMLGALPGEMEHCYFTKGNFTTENLSSLASVVEFVRLNNIKLVIIDSLIRVHQRDENSSVEMNKVFERLAELQYAGAAVFYLHHLNKGTETNNDPMNRLRGSVDISARLDSLIAMEKTENFITVTHAKSRYTQEVPKFMMEFVVNQAGKATFYFHKDVEESQVKAIACEDEILNMLRQGSSMRQHIVDSLQERHSLRTISDALVSLYTSGKITRWKQTGKGNPTVYSINKIQSFIENE